MPRYGARELGRHAWHTCGGWRQWDCGDWGRVYACGRRRVARRARVYREGGMWRWRVEEFDLGTRAVRRVAGRSAAAAGYWSPAAAFPFADLAARSD